MMKIGYARLHKGSQEASKQIEMLREAGCLHIFVDEPFGFQQKYAELEAALNYMQAGDVLVVWRLDRLGRSLKHLLQTIVLLGKCGVGLQSLKDDIDTTRNEQSDLFKIFEALETFDKNIRREQTMKGLAAARARGRNGGRPKALNREQRDRLFELYDGKQFSIQELCEMMKISKPTLYNYLKERSED